jgi:hypothetical protein
VDKLKKEILIALFWTAVIICLILFVGFAEHNELTGIPNAKNHIFGFWYGVSQGFLCVIALIGSLFNKGINIYEIHNTGFGYNIGFLIGILLWSLSPKFFKK